MKLSKGLWSLVKQIEIMKKREQEIGKLLELLSRKSSGFTKPKLVLIGGYALRAFVPFSRYTRDCDFALRKKNGWTLDQITNWLSKSTAVESFEKRDDYGFLRCVRVFDETIKASLDFMEGKVVGRDEKRQVVIIDEKFVENSNLMKLKVAEKEIEVFVPTYDDYMILKIVSCRPSDVRDITTLVWKNGIPSQIHKRAKKILPDPKVFDDNLRKIVIPQISDERFVNSWRGTFLAPEFNDDIKRRVINQLRSIVK
jgi:hypothetical protein